MTTTAARNPDAQSTARQKKRRRRAFIVAALALGLFAVAMLELALRAAGVSAETTHQDPLVGFSRLSPLFELDEDAGVYRTSRSRTVLFEQQEFLARKPTNGFRIFCLGGSTVRGRPYTTETAFARWMQLELSCRDAAHTYEVVNCGGLSYASYRLTHILEEVLHYEPDMIIVATGHNEFLEDRTYGDIKSRSSWRVWLEDRAHQLRMVRLLREWTVDPADNHSTASDGRPVLPELVETRLDEASGYASYHRDDVWAADVAKHFDQSLQTMVTLCEGARIPLVFVLLGANVRDCPPFKSEHRPGLDVDQQRQWQTEYSSAQQQEDPLEALARYEAAAAIDDEYALLRFRMGRVFDQLGRVREAEAHYLAAKDFDVCPLRMLESFAATLREIAAESGTPLVDVRTILEQRSQGGIPGNDWYMDHVHPSIGAHQLIAQAIVGTLTENLLTPTLMSWSDETRRRHYREHLRNLGPIYLTNGYERVNWLERWARRQRLIDETLPSDPEGHLRYGHRSWDFDLREVAWRHYHIAITATPDLGNRLIERAESLFDQGRGPEALLLLDELGNIASLNLDNEIEQARRQMEDQSG